jgi:hypothetical protein
MTPEQIRLIRQIADAIVATVREAGPQGAPGGVIYAALMAQGCTFNQFQSLMSGLLRTGRLALDGDCYTIPAAAPERAA